MALAYTAPTWQNGGGVGISASQLQALSDCMEGLVQGSDKAITNIAISGQTITLTFADGSVETGTASGLKGIVSITKTGTSGLVDTYTIAYTDGSTSTFTVTNGATGPAGPTGPQGPQGIQGPQGDEGFSPEVTITTITGGHRVNITDEEHPDGQNFDVMDGANAVIPNPQGTSVGNLTSIGINGDKYEIQGGGGSGVTFTLYSATQDTVTISQNGTTVETVTIASGNSVDVTLPKGRYLFTSSIAKNPDDLSAFYSKDVTITPVVIDVYLMPDNVLYWYGYQSSNLENLSTANGWVHQNTSYTFNTPVYNTNYITCSNGNNQVGGIATKNKISLKTAHGILEYKTGSSNGAAIAIDTSNKVVGASYYDIYTGASAAANVLEHISCSIQNTESKYTLIETGANRSYQLYALWYDTESTDISDKANKTDIAPVESGTTASRAYAVGQQFYLNGSLYKATAAIASGATFTVGTNCELADCITEQINNSYSTTEKKTGDLWIDGKEIYQKVIDFGTLPNNTIKLVNSGTQIKECVSIDFMTISSTSYEYRNVVLGVTEVGIYPYNSNQTSRRNYMYIVTNADKSNLSCKIIIRYTKP